MKTADFPRLISVVVPVYNEAENIVPFLRELEPALTEPHEILIVYDFPEDSTLPALRAMTPACPTARLVHNTLGKGVLPALRAGFQAARGDVVVVMMADRSDEPSDVMPMVQRIRAGADVVAGSRYCPGGRQIGGPPLKRFLSWLAGASLHWLAGLPIRDATNNFRAYSRRTLALPVESSASFVLAMELTVKAYWNGYRIEEVPTTWRDREAGESRFPLFAWLPHYLRWYLKTLKRAWLGPMKLPRPE